MLIVLDALDEAGPVGTKPRKDLLQFLAAKMLSLAPAWVKVLVTSRPEPDIITAFARFDAHEILESDARHADDLRLFIQRRLGEAGVPEGPARDELAALMLLKSEKKFVYMVMVAEALSGIDGRDEEEVHRAVTELPEGLDASYTKFMQQLKTNYPNQWAGCVAVMRLFVASQRPLLQGDVEALMRGERGFEVERVAKLLHTIFPLRPAGNSAQLAFVPYHKSLVDWVTDFDRAGDEFYLLGREAQESLAARLLGALGMDDDKGSVVAAWGAGGRQLAGAAPSPSLSSLRLVTDSRGPCAEYAADFLLDHLDAAGLGALALQLLWSLEWLQAMLRMRGVGAVVAALRKRLGARGEDKELKLLAQFFTLITGAQAQCGAEIEESIKANFSRHPWDAEVCTQLVARCEGKGMPGGRLVGLVTEARRWLEKKGGWIVAVGQERMTQPGGDCEVVISGHSKWVYAVLGLIDGRLASGSYDGTLRIVHVESGAVDQVLQVGSPVYALVEFPDKRLVTASGNGEVRVWTPTCGDYECSAVLEGHTASVSSLALLLDGRLASGSHDKTVRMWSEAGEGWSCSAVLKGHTGYLWALSVLSDGRLASGSQETVRVWSEGSGGWSCNAVLEGHSGSVNALALLSDGRLASGSMDRTLRVWSEAGEGWSYSAVLEGHTDHVSSLALLLDGRLASGSNDKTVRVWSEAGEGWSCSAVLEGHTDLVSSLAVLSDGRLASGSDDKTVRVWSEVRDIWSCNAVLKGHSGWIKALALLSDGRLASGSDDKTVRVWSEVRDGWSCSAVLKGHTDSVKALSVLPDGRLASGSEDKTMRVWSEAGEGWSCSAVLEGHTEGVIALAVLSDGRMASGSWNKTVRVWSLESLSCDSVSQSDILPICLLELMRNGVSFDIGASPIWNDVHCSCTLRLSADTWVFGYSNGSLMLIRLMKL